jgi:hypothetical protein
MYADGGKNNQANMLPGDKVRVLVPELFGGGSLDGTYEDYGVVSTGDGGVDVYELLALWNSAELVDVAVNLLGFDEEEVRVKFMGGAFTRFARNVGIRIGCYDDDMVRLQYPLRVVPIENASASYETVGGVSVGDPNQGFYARPWGDYDMGDSLDAYLDELRAQNAREGRSSVGDVALTDDERASFDGLPRLFRKF